MAGNRQSSTNISFTLRNGINAVMYHLSALVRGSAYALPFGHRWKASTVGGRLHGMRSMTSLCPSRDGKLCNAAASGSAASQRPVALSGQHRRNMGGHPHAVEARPASSRTGYPDAKRYRILHPKQPSLSWEASDCAGWQEERRAPRASSTHQTTSVGAWRRVGILARRQKVRESGPLVGVCGSDWRVVKVRPPTVASMAYKWHLPSLQPTTLSREYKLQQPQVH